MRLRSKTIERARISDSAEYMPELTPDQRLVFQMFLRATRDAIETAIIPNHIRADAKQWILSANEDPFSSKWWAELAGLEIMLRCCRKIVRERYDGTRQRLLSWYRSGEEWSMGDY